jgi:CheY-like chemotaxis protein
MILELEGYRVSTVSNGKEALDLLRVIEPPCLILLDLMMPVMNGWEFLKAQKGDSALATIPVVVVSAAHGMLPRPPEADAAMKKPVDLEVLLKVVRDWCGAPR